MLKDQLPDRLRFPFQPKLQGEFPGGIGLIACGEITEHHLEAYRARGLPVRILCDLDPAKAEHRRDKFYPTAKTCTDYRTVLDDPDVTIVDIATHPRERTQIIRQAILAGKHILSQKPFVEKLAEGEQLVQLATTHQVRLAVNQNARWAPHFAFIREAISRGVIGDLNSIRFQLHWDHTWTRGTPFEHIYHLLLYDFAIHWFDLMQAFSSGASWLSVYAQVRQTKGQAMAPPLLAHVTVEYPNAQASLCLDGNSPYFPLNQTMVAGSAGQVHSTGLDYSQQSLTFIDAAGQFAIPLTGGWFPDGFGGAMIELANSINENREPTHSARENLKSLELCFAAVAAAELGRPIKPGEVQRLPMHHNPE